MAETVPLVASALLGYVVYTHWQQGPSDPIAYRAQVVGSSTDTKADKKVPIYSSAYGVNIVDGRDSQVPNPHVRSKLPRVKGAHGPSPYYDVQPDSSFEISGVDATAKDQYDQSMEISSAWLKGHPASVPISERHHTSSHRTPRIHANARSQQYLGAATASRLASVPMSQNGGGNRVPHPVKHIADLARATRSGHSGTLVSGTKPAVYMDPNSPHYATSTTARIYTGRHARTVY